MLTAKDVARYLIALEKDIEVDLEQVEQLLSFNMIGDLIEYLEELTEEEDSVVLTAAVIVLSKS